MTAKVRGPAQVWSAFLPACHGQDLYEQNLTLGLTFHCTLRRWPDGCGCLAKLPSSCSTLRIILHPVVSSMLCDMSPVSMVCWRMLYQNMFYARFHGPEFVLAFTNYTITC